MPKSGHLEEDSLKDGAEHFERTLGKIAGLMTLAKEYDEVDCYDGVVAAPERCATA